MQAYVHAKASARKYGGTAEDYIDIHEWLDSSKLSHGDVRHRALYHHTLGVQLAQQIFGRERINSDGKPYIVKDIAELHIVQDLGWIPSPTDWLKNMNIVAFMDGKVNKHISREEVLKHAKKN